MTIWIIALTAVTIINTLGAVALWAITNKRMREMNFHIAVVSDAAATLHRRINQSLGDLPMQPPTEDEPGKIDALIKKYYRKPPQ